MMPLPHATQSPPPYPAPPRPPFPVRQIVVEEIRPGMVLAEWPHVELWPDGAGSWPLVTSEPRSAEKHDGQYVVVGTDRALTTGAARAA